MAKKTTRRRVSLGDRPTPPPVPAKPKKPRTPRSTSMKQAGQAAARSNKFRPAPLGPNKPKVTPPNKSVPRSAPNLSSAAKLTGRAAIDAAKSTARFFNPGRKVALAATAVVAGVNTARAISGLAGDNKKKTTPKKTVAKKAPGMTMSQARQEVAQSKRVQASKRAAAKQPVKKTTAKQTAYRQTRRWGTSREAFQLAKQNRNRPRG